MEPLNQSERRKAFLGFLLFFTITIAVVVIAVFSSMQVPFAENRKLKTEKAIADNERNTLVEFDKKLVETTMMLDSFESARDKLIAEVNIEKNIKAMTSLVSGSGVVGSICTRIIDNLSSLFHAKQLLLERGATQAEVEKKEAEIHALEERIRQLNQMLLQSSAQ